MLELTEDQLRQFSDAEAALRALEDARRNAWDCAWLHVRACREGPGLPDSRHTGARQQSLGARSPETEDIHRSFTERKNAVGARFKSLSNSVKRQRRLNRALRVGRAPNLLMKILNSLQTQGIAVRFIVAGTHAPYAYGAVAGVRIARDALATQDVDLLFDTHNRLAILSRLPADDVSLLQVLREADKSFEIREDQKQTAVNDKGYEVDIWRMARDDDPHPLRLSHHEDQLWAGQVPGGDKMLGAAGCAQVIVATDGSTARLVTVAPRGFVKLEPGKRS